MDKSIETSLLFDFYGQLLSEKKRMALHLYFNEDLSLSEVALHMGITRQGVRDLIKRSQSELYDFENKLGIYNRFEAINESVGKIKDLSEHLVNTTFGQTQETAEKIFSEAVMIEQLEA